MEPPSIRCQVCCREANPHLTHYCPHCARVILNEVRVQNAGVLLSKEASHDVVERAFNKNVSLRRSSEYSTGEVYSHRTVTYQQDRAAYSKYMKSKAWMREQTAKTKNEIEELNAEITRMKSQLAERKSLRQGAQRELARQEHVALATLSDSGKKAEAKWKSILERTADVRVFLCKELGSLCGLVHRKRHRGLSSPDQYLLGQVPIIDLRDLNSSSPALITVSIGRVAHFICIAAHYLSVRLPAEIVLPSSTSAYPQILPPSLSYKDPGLPSGQKKRALPGHPTGASPRPRTLHLEKSLRLLASHDSLAYSLFIDAITYLAWDVTWLARTQGLDVGSTHWEEICAMGKTLYTLFGPSTGTRDDIQVLNTEEPSKQKFSSQDHQLRTTQLASSPLELNLGVDTLDRNSGSPGHLSHSSAARFLPASANMGGGADFMRLWPFSNPKVIIDKIKSALLSERMAAEWEMVTEGEWIDSCDKVH